jgi:hypothetical protein
VAAPSLPLPLHSPRSSSYFCWRYCPPWQPSNAVIWLYRPLTCDWCVRWLAVVHSRVSPTYLVTLHFGPASALHLACPFPGDMLSVLWTTDTLSHALAHSHRDPLPCLLTVLATYTLTVTLTHTRCSMRVAEQRVLRVTPCIFEKPNSKYM